MRPTAPRDKPVTQTPSITVKSCLLSHDCCWTVARNTHTHGIFMSSGSRDFVIFILELYTHSVIYFFVYQCGTLPRNSEAFLKSQAKLFSVKAFGIQQAFHLHAKVTPGLTKQRLFPNIPRDENPRHPSHILGAGGYDSRDLRCQCVISNHPKSGRAVKEATV